MARGMLRTFHEPALGESLSAQAQGTWCPPQSSYSSIQSSSASILGIDVPSTPLTLQWLLSPPWLTLYVYAVCRP